MQHRRLRFGVAMVILAALVAGGASYRVWRGSEPSRPAVPHTTAYHSLSASVSDLAEAEKDADAVETSAEETNDEPVPKVVVDRAEHDFGVMDVASQGEHTFVIRNAGKGVLRLRTGGTSCKCTLLDMPNGEVPPGKEIRVRVEWETAEAREYFRQGAIVWTNDPDCPQLQLRLVGKVRHLLTASPYPVVFTSVPPNERCTQQALLYSQIWEEFEITQVESTHPKINCTFQPASAEELAAQDALSGYRVAVAVEPGLPVGSFLGHLRIQTRVADQVKTKLQQPFELDVVGEALGYFTLYHPEMDRRGFLEMGQMQHGKGKKETIYLHVRGDHKDLEIKQIITNPDFIHVTVRPDTRAGTKPGRYAIDLEIPPGTPVISCLRPDLAQVKIVTNHPHTPSIRFQVELLIY